MNRTCPALSYGRVRNPSQLHVSRYWLQGGSIPMPIVFGRKCKSGSAYQCRRLRRAVLSQDPSQARPRLFTGPDPTSSKPSRPSRILASSKARQHLPQIITPDIAARTSRKPQKFRDQHRQSQNPSVGRIQRHSLPGRVPAGNAGAAALTHSTPPSTRSNLAEDGEQYHSSPPPGPAGSPRGRGQQHRPG